MLFDNSLNVADISGNTLMNNSIASSEIDLPGSWGAGVSLTGRRVVFAADFRYQKWSVTTDRHANLNFTDTHKFDCGVAFVPSRIAPKSYFELIEYQAGFAISNSYLTLNDVNPLDVEITAGAGLPLRRGGQLNLGLGWGKKGTINEGLIREDYLRFTLSLSMAERMFLKRMYD
jgi:hypothetical protein